MNDHGDELEHEGEPDEGRANDSTAPRIRVILAEGARSYKVSGGTAELKIQRAKDHFSEFRDELQDYYSQAPWKIRPIRDGPDLALIIESHLPVPDSLALIAGDLLYNARSALDCIVMELAELGHGSLGRPPQSDREERSLSFPIGDSPLSADKYASLVRFLPVETVEGLRLLQPVETTKRRLATPSPDEITDDLVRARVHDDFLLRLHTLNNWDKHRRLTFSFLVPQSVSDGSDVGTLTVVSRPGELADLRGISWLGIDEQSTRTVRIEDPEVLADMEKQVQYPDFDFHFSWWPLSAGDEIGRYIPHPGCGPVPDITTEASLRLVLFEPDLFRRGQIMATPADRFLAEIIDEVEYVVALLRELGHE